MADARHQYRIIRRSTPDRGDGGTTRRPVSENRRWSGELGGGVLDQRALATQLGLQAPIMPRRAGPMLFGTSVRLDTGSRARPGALVLTRIDMGSPAGLLRLREYARPVLGAMASMDSVIGAAIFSDGQGMGYTVSAWVSPEAATEIMSQDQHRSAMRAFLSDGLGVAAWTSVWVPARFNTFGSAAQRVEP